MVDERIVSGHYKHDQLLDLIKNGLREIGKSIDSVTIEDLAPVDEFHIGGRTATEHLVQQLGFGAFDILLDIGCGLGGASRFIAKNYGNSVTGIDLTDDFVSVGNTLTNWVGLDQSVSLRQGSALSMPFDDAMFDGAYMLHVGMNIESKDILFSEISRVLKPGSRFGIYDVMRMSEGALTYPVPWASEENSSFLAAPEVYSALLESAGFRVECVNNRKEFALKFFDTLKQKSSANDGPPPLGLHLLMKSTAPLKFKNMIEGITRGYISPVEIVATKI
ncbi:MAG TPA: SAM-dependent methyltransferase [Porticoccaceae bacterium]|nr:SAM-dependent methyltransferase [Porticoccaceae bacterium]